MASHEHLQQLDEEDDSSTSTSSSTSSSDDDSTGISASSVGPQDVNNDDAMDVDEESNEPSERSSGSPKRRIKLQLRLPKHTSENGDSDTAKPAAVAHVSKEGDEDDEEDDEEVVKATIVHSDGEDGDDVVEATVVEEKPSSTAKAVPSSSSSAAQAKPKSSSKSRRSPTPLVQTGRPVRLPPISSPGLLIPPTAGVFRGDADVNGFTTPSSVFSRAMSLAGYTTEGRTQNPHRGSSVQRVVDDMFDSNILFTLHFPPLVPDELWNKVPSKSKQPNEEGSPGGEPAMDDKGETLPQLLIRALSKPESEKTQMPNGDVTMQDVSPSEDTQKRKRKPCSFMDMSPLSLTIPYPESYIQKRVKYVQQVKARERAIVASQEAAQAKEDAMEAYEEALAAYNGGTKKSQGDENGANGPPVPPPVPSPVEVPPIPTPPSPPRQSQSDGPPVENADDSQHPIYLPEGKENFVAHLDKECFHITDGRYYGLLTNTIADPHFVGPNAPGIGGLNLSGATGLATSYIGSSGNSGAGSSQAYYGGSVGGGSSGSVVGGSSKNTGESSKSSKKGPASSSGDSAATSSKVAKKSTSTGPSPTSTSTDLKKFMEQDNADLVEKMKVCIIRAAVYASRLNMHGGSFVGTDRETYPDISKAFAAHAGLRPCNRCKNNKQGAYHCRLRRKHKDIDYDGGNSWEVLAPLFQEPVDDLLQK